MEATEMNQRVLDYCTLTVISPQLVSCEFTKNLYFTSAIALNIFHQCDQMMASRYKILWIMHTKLKPDNQVMNAFADPSRSKRTVAEAFCLESTGLRLLANFYFRVKKPKVPGRVFDSKEAASVWLTSKNAQLAKEVIPLEAHPLTNLQNRQTT